MGPKLDPNRIFDAEALRKPLGGLLERSWRLLEPKKVSLEASWSALGALKRGRVIHSIFEESSGRVQGEVRQRPGESPLILWGQPLPGQIPCATITPPQVHF